MNRAGPSRSKLGDVSAATTACKSRKKTPENRKRTVSMMTAERERQTDRDKEILPLAWLAKLKTLSRRPCTYTRLYVRTYPEIRVVYY
jgi:hypothetical protein